MPCNHSHVSHNLSSPPRSVHSPSCVHERRRGGQRSHAYRYSHHVGAVRARDGIERQVQTGTKSAQTRSVQGPTPTPPPHRSPLSLAPTLSIHKTLSIGILKVHTETSAIRNLSSTRSMGCIRRARSRWPRARTSPSRHWSPDGTWRHRK